MTLLYIEREQILSFKSRPFFQKIAKPNLIELTPLNVDQSPLYVTQTDCGAAVNQVVIRQLRFYGPCMPLVVRNVFIFH